MLDFGAVHQKIMHSSQEAAALFTICGKPHYLALPMVTVSIMTIAIDDEREMAPEIVPSTVATVSR